MLWLDWWNDGIILKICLYWVCLRCNFDICNIVIYFCDGESVIDSLRWKGYFLIMYGNIIWYCIVVSTVIIVVCFCGKVDLGVMEIGIDIVV